MAFPSRRELLDGLTGRLLGGVFGMRVLKND
ncbi:MAG: hypothetical protein UW03_C0013G0012 [Candidatus Peregrinibacteria bacterium GW2011_GWA2_43_8]|nr:MAG: hypothetical protein UW03_C0013G0012 [Candidatus Peregrinibacteria bacterium GW2011_GWA2_43_8]